MFRFDDERAHPFSSTTSSGLVHVGQLSRAEVPTFLLPVKLFSVFYKSSTFVAISVKKVYINTCMVRFSQAWAIPDVKWLGKLVHDFCLHEVTVMVDFSWLVDDIVIFSAFGNYPSTAVSLSRSPLSYVPMDMADSFISLLVKKVETTRAKHTRSVTTRLSSSCVELFRSRCYR